MSIPRILYYKYKLDKNLNKSRSEILKLRENKFRKLLYYAYNNSPFYHDFYSAHGIKEKDLSEIKHSDLPALDKNIMMENYDKLVTDKNISCDKIASFLENSPSPVSKLNNKYHVIHSSGSSGEVGYFLYNSKEWDFIKALSLRLFTNFGLKRKRYAFIGAADGHYAGISLFLSPVNALEEYFYKQYLVININHPLEDYCQRLNECRPHNLTGYPFGIKVLAEMQRTGKIDISPEVVICGGEPLTAAARKFIKKTWDTSLINYYAASESLVIGVKKEEFNHLYIFDDANYIETAEEGYYLTNLYNYTQPLIRYRMSDLLVSVNEQKNEDRWPFNRVKEIIGRQEDILWFKNQAGKKEFIHPIIFVELYIRGLNKYQVIQTGETSFIFKAVIKKGSKNEDVIVKIKEELTKILQSKNLQNVNFRIKKVKNIDGAGTTGKFKLIKREFK